MDVAASAFLFWTTMEQSSLCESFTAFKSVNRHANIVSSDYKVIHGARL
jgi:hypothetical protein